MTAKPLSLVVRLNAASAEAQEILAGTDLLMERRETLIDERLRLLRDLIRTGRNLHDYLSTTVQRRG